jgi:hypothetical protein
MNSSVSLKHALRALLALVTVAPVNATFALEAQKVEVYKSPTCGCCTEWVGHMRRNGFDVVVHDVRDVMPYRDRYGVPDAMSSCHTALVGGYVVEGHVPATDVKRLLREKPKAAGIAVPGMVQGSPGMEQGQGSDPYKVILFKKGEWPRIFARH